jgi:aryl-alcohol dehydrogenase
MAANTLPLAKIIAIDIMPERLATARTLGATDVINSREEDVHARIMEITGGKGVNYVAEATGVISGARRSRCRCTFR